MGEAAAAGAEQKIQEKITKVAPTASPAGHPAKRSLHENPSCTNEASNRKRLFVLATSSTRLLALAKDDLAKHDNTVAIHEGARARRTLAVVVGCDNIVKGDQRY